MMKSFTTLKFLLVFALSLSSQLFAANVQSVKSGSWDDPTVWSTGAVPATGDNVVIKVGHFVQSTQINPSIELSNFTIEATGIFHIGDRNFRVNGATNISGTFKDLNTNGTNIFQGKVTIGAGGIWNTLAVSSSTQRIVFGGGIEINGDSMLVRVASFSWNNQVISGNTQMYIAQELFVNPGITITNENSAGMFFDEGSIRSNDLSARFINKTLLRYHHRNPPMTPGSVDFSTPGNTVIYGRRDRQFIRPAVHYNMIIDDHALATDENSKVLQAGASTIVLNDFTLNQFAEFNTEDQVLDVRGNAIVRGEIFDGKFGGQVSFNNLLLDNGKILGQTREFGNFIVTGTFNVQGPNPSLEDGNWDIQGQTIVASNTNLNLKGLGIDTKKFNQVTLQPGASYRDIGNNSTITFRGLVTIEDGSFFMKQDTYFENGFDHTGDTLSVLGNTFFTRNDQEARSSTDWVLKKPINIASGIRAILNIEGGLDVPTNIPYILVEDTTAIFSNKGKLIFNENNPKLSGVKTDFTEAGNEVVMNMLPGAYVEIPGGDFHSLTILNQREATQRMDCYLPADTIHARGDFTVGRNISFRPDQYDMQVDGWAKFYGEIFDNNVNGVLNFGNMVLDRAEIDGLNWRRTNIMISGDLVVEDTVSIDEADFSVGGTTTIKSNGLLILSTRQGDRSFGGLIIEQDGELLDNTPAEDFTFDGPIELAGKLSLSNGICTFTHPVVITETGTLSFSREWGSYNFSKRIINNGTVALGSGFFSIAGEVGGMSEIALISDIFIGAGDTLVNTNSAGFYRRGIFKRRRRRESFCQ